MSENNKSNSSYNSWKIEYRDYDPAKERSREALLTVGNGYFGTRGALEETSDNDINYPGTYMAGLYNRLISKVADRDIENEDFVNCPNWLPLNFKIKNNSWFDINHVEIDEIERSLDFRNGLLERNVLVKDKVGHETRISSRRMASMAKPNLAAIQYDYSPVNYSGKVTFKSGLDGDIINDGVERYSQLNQHHLRGLGEGAEKNFGWLSVETVQSEVEIAEGFVLNIFLNNEKIEPKLSHTISTSQSFLEFEIDLNEGDVLRIEKLVSIRSSHIEKKKDLVSVIRKDLDKSLSFDQMLEDSAREWAQIWKKIDITIEGDEKSQTLIRLHLYHIMVTASPRNVHLDAGIPARGLHGEAYRGHIFWDELYVLPLYYLHFPEVARSVLMYRYRRLDEAKKYAKKHNYEGAMYPWQSGSDGREETQVVHLNPLSGEWGPDYSSLQRHISIAVAFNIYNYYWFSSDLSFMEKYGAEMFLDICKFWASKSEYDEKTERYEIRHVMGPDEFHEKYPWSEEGGLDNNAYTNIMVAWLFIKANELVKELSENVKNDILKKCGISDDVLDHWAEMSENMKVIISDEEIIEQFEGYFKLKELDWDEYREKYKNIHRMDRILKAEGLSPDDFKLAKQADTIMVFYNLDQDVVKDILYDMGHYLDDDYLEKNYQYYIERTSHGSTLSRVVHAYVANLIGKKDEAWKLYQEALESDFVDIQGGTTGEGIHAGVMGGTAYMAISSFAGIRFYADHLIVKPVLPKKWKRIQFNFTFKENNYIFDISQHEIVLEVKSDHEDIITIQIGEEEHELKTNTKNTISYS